MREAKKERERERERVVKAFLKQLARYDMQEKYGNLSEHACSTVKVKVLQHLRQKEH